MSSEYVTLLTASSADQQFSLSGSFRKEDDEEVNDKQTDSRSLQPIKP